MNFVQLLKSLDELLYEVMSWLVFYPVTLWRTLMHPLRMMDYADKELADRLDKQYDDTLSPPLFLLISLFISHGVELALIGDNPLVAETQGLAGLISDDTSLLMMRLLLFSIFPLIMAARLVRSKAVGLTRDTLRPSFYSQCYVAAPFVLMVSIAATLLGVRGQPWAVPAAAALTGIALVWYGVVQTHWFARHLRKPLTIGFLTATVAMVESVAIVLLIAWLFG